MSANINIIQEEDRSVDVTVRANTITVKVTEWHSKVTEFHFDMTNSEHRKALKFLVVIMQQQLELHETYGTDNDR